jgi:hypothetical protein
MAGHGSAHVADADEGYFFDVRHGSFPLSVMSAEAGASDEPRCDEHASAAVMSDAVMSSAVMSSAVMSVAVVKNNQHN